MRFCELLRLGRYGLVRTEEVRIRRQGLVVSDTIKQLGVRWLLQKFVGLLIYEMQACWFDRNQWQVSQVSFFLSFVVFCLLVTIVERVA